MIWDQLPFKLDLWTVHECSNSVASCFFRGWYILLGSEEEGAGFKSPGRFSSTSRAHRYFLVIRRSTTWKQDLTFSQISCQRSITIKHSTSLYSYELIALSLHLSLCHRLWSNIHLMNFFVQTQWHSSTPPSLAFYKNPLSVPFLPFFPSQLSPFH